MRGKKRIRARGLAAVLLAGLMTLSFTACQEDPEGSIVVNKDMDKLISQGAAPQSSEGTPVLEEAQKTESYETTIENEKLGVKVVADAQVDVPTVEKLSIYRVEQKKFDQAFLDKVREVLIGDAALYEGKALRTRTKSEIEAEIQALRQSLTDTEQQLADDPELSDEEREGQLQDYADEVQRSVDELQEEYEVAPETINLSEYPSDGQLLDVLEMARQNPGDEYYEWMGGLSEEGDELFYGVTDGSDGWYQALYVGNNSDYSNKCAYRKNSKEYLKVDTVLATDSVEISEAPARYGITSTWEDFYEEKGIKGTLRTTGYEFGGGTTFRSLSGATVELSPEEAQRQAEELLEKLEMGGFALHENQLCTELVGGGDDPNELLYENCYMLTYYRELDGVLLTQSSGTKFQAGWDENNENYNKQMWPQEEVLIRVNDQGIVGFDYNAPLNVIETVVEGTSLKGFDEVKEIFEQMLPTIMATTDWQYVAQVDRVRLSYSRISEKDSFDTGLVVPVWSFEGKTSTYDTGYLVSEDKGVLLAINAIDGSVIDAELGY